MTFDIPSQQLKCGRCDRTMSIAEADEKEARTAENSFSVDLLTCPTCGAEIRAVNTASATFCSYCGASVMLDRKEAEMDPPDTIAPFRVTREQCFEKYQSLLKKSLCVDHRLKKNVTAESFRGIYVPHYVYSGSVTGSATLQGTETHGNDTYYYNTTVSLNHQFDDILHDASKEMPDALSERIARVEQKDFRPFSPAYLSGFYADIPDTKESAYVPFAKAETVRNGLADVMKDLKGNTHYSTGEAEKKLIPLAEAHCTGHTLVPVWFMSIRTRTGRLLYAVQNGVTGEMAADTPLDIPLFGLLALIVAIPLFFLLNIFLTLRPEMVLVAAMALAVAAQAVVNRRRTSLRDKETAEKTATSGKDNFSRRLKQRKRFARGAGGSSVTDTLKSLGIVGGVLVFAAVLHGLSLIDAVAYFTLGAAILTGIMAVLLFVDAKGKVAAPVGCYVAFALMVIGVIVMVINPFHSDDLPLYILAFLTLAAVIWESVDLLMMHNRDCSNPLPQFKTHQGGEDHA